MDARATGGLPVNQSLCRDRPAGVVSGGAEGQNRTGDTMIFSHVLYRLSYLGPGSQRRRGRPPFTLRYLQPAWQTGPGPNAYTYGAMMNSSVTVPEPRNEPVLNYAPGSPEKHALKTQLDRFADDCVEIPLIIGGQDVKTGNCGRCILPHDHARSVASVPQGRRPPRWSRRSPQPRGRGRPGRRCPGRPAPRCFSRRRTCSRAGTARSSTRRPCSTRARPSMQAEIDAACELIDFLRFNPSYMRQIFEQQPTSQPGTWNYVEYRPLEGFVFAVTPFNFTAIAGNLPTSPAMMGNTVVWKPSSTAVFSAYWLMRVLAEAGLPDGVINMVPGSGGAIGDPVMNHPDLGGVHFTGSTEVFQGMWATVGRNIRTYRSYPRIVGETGGKDFVFAHASADPDELVAGLIRGAFEYQGQKCSAASRAYIPQSLWATCRDRLCDEVELDRLRRRRGLHQLHGRRHRQGVVRPARGRHRGSPGQPGRRRDLRRRVQRRDRVLRRADTHPGPRAALPDDGDGAVRPGPHDLRVPGRPLRRGARAVRHDVALRADRARSLPATGRRSTWPATSCAMPPATSTSTTSPPARSSAASRSAAPAPRAPTTRRAAP